MVPKQILKEILVSNEEALEGLTGQIVVRDGIFFPERLNKVVVLYGVRRSGKTFILYDIWAKFEKRALYVDFEDDRLEGFTKDDFANLTEAFLELNPPRGGAEIVLLLDEIQNVEGWERFCRRAVERSGMKVLVSGSSSRMMPSEIHTELRGRSWEIEVFPFSFREFLRARGIQISDRSLLYGSRKAETKRIFLEFLRFGGFPEAALAVSEMEKKKLLREYMGAMFFRDLVERFRLTNISLLDLLFEKLFSSFSLKVSLTALYKQYKQSFPFSKDLLYKYYKHLLDSMLILEVRKFAESHYTRVRNPPKVYLVDCGLAKKVLSQDLGRLLENAVFLWLRRKFTEIFYWEGKRECDFLAKQEDGSFMPIQVCYDLTPENRVREIEGLVEACRTVSSKEGLLITFDEEGEEKAEGVRVRILPGWRYFLE
jgi:uncharacterized protein